MQFIDSETDDDDDLALVDAGGKIALLVSSF